MAATELEIVVRARDQLTAALKAMGSSVDRLAVQAREAFAQVTASIVPTEAAATAAASAAAQIAPAAQAAVGPVQALGDAGARLDISARVQQAEEAFRALGRVDLGPLELDVATARAEVERIRGSAQAAGGALSELDRRRLDQLEREAKEGEAAIRRLRGATNEAEGGVRRLDGAFRTLRNAVLPLVPVLSLAGGAFAAQRSVQQVVAFEDALSRLQVQADLSDGELARLREGALTTARALGFAEAQAGPALIAAVTDGARSAAEGLDRFRTSAELARTVGSDLGKTIDLQTSILNAYRDSNLEAGRAADVTFGILRGGKVEIEDLAGSLDAVLPLAAQSGVAFEELGAVIVTATEKGGGFAQGMQAVRAVMSAITDPSKEARAALAGVDFTSARVRAEGLVPVLVDVARALEGDSERIRAVFPDGRAFGALLAVLGDEGRALSESLDRLRSSAGGVQEALGDRLQSPAVQLGIVFNRLRSEFSEAFGGAFLRSVSDAVTRMGGLDSATEKVAASARGIGVAFGAAVPAIATGMSEIADLSARVAGLFTGAGDALRGFGEIGGAALRVVAGGFRELLELIDFTLDVLRAGSKGGFFFGGLDEAGIGKLNAALLQTGQLLLTIQATEGRPAGESLVQRLPEIEELKRALAELPESVGVEIPVSFDRESVQRLRGQLSAAFDAERASIDLRANINDAFDEILRDTTKVGEGVTAALTDAVESATPRVDPFEFPVAIDLAAAQEQLALFEAQLAGLREDAADRIAIGDIGGLAVTTREAVILAERLDAARDAVTRLRSERAGDLEEDLKAATAEATRLERASSVASEALGMEAAAPGLDAARDRVRDLRTEIASLRGESTEITESLSIKRVGRVELSDVLGLDTRRFATELRETAGILERELHAAVAGGDVITAERLFSQREQAELVLRARQTAEEAVGEFARFEDLRGALEFDADTTDLERAQRELEALSDALVDVAQERGRLVGATDDERQALRAHSAALVQEVRSARLAEERVRALGDAVSSLPSAATVLLQIVNAEVAAAVIEDIHARADALSKVAAVLGVEVDASDMPEEIETAIEAARAQLERERLAFVLGVEVDDAAIEKAQRQIADMAAKVERAALDREAVRLGLALETDNLERDVIEARDVAQRFADQLSSRGLVNEAITLGVSVEGSDREIETRIQTVQLEAQEFAARNPIKAELAVSGIDGLSRALGEFVNGFDEGREAMNSFFRSFLSQAATAIARAFLLRTLISAVGGPQAGFGSFLASTFGVPTGAALGQAFVAGGLPGDTSPGNALTSTRTGSSAPGGSPLWTVPVAAFEAGGAPDLYRPLWTRVEPYARGGSPYIDQIVSRPTLERSERLAGSAIVPLSGGGVATTGGDRLPLERRGSELVVSAVRNAYGGLHPADDRLTAAYASGGAPWALFGEAGLESVMRLHRAPGGRPGLLAADGAVLPLTRVAGGRLGVEAYAGGGVPSYRAPIAAYASGGFPSDAPSTSGPVRVAVALSVPVTVQASGGAPRADAEELGARIRVAISSDRSVRDAVAAVVAATVEAQPAYRASIRGDRA